MLQSPVMTYIGRISYGIYATTRHCIIACGESLVRSTYRFLSEDPCCS